MKINQNKSDKEKVRVLARLDPSLQIAINAYLTKGVAKYEKPDPKSLILTLPESGTDGKVTLTRYLFRSPATDPVQTLFDTVQRHLKAE